MPIFSNKATFPNLLAEQFSASLPFSSRYMTRYETINPADASSSSSSPFRPWIQVQWIQKRKRKKKLLLLLQRRQHPFNSSTQAKQSTRPPSFHEFQRGIKIVVLQTHFEKNHGQFEPNVHSRRRRRGHSLLCKNSCG